MFSGCPGFGSDFLEQWPDSLMHALCLPLYPSFFLFWTRAVQAAHSWASFLCIRGCFAHHLSTLHFARRHFNMQPVPMMLNMIRTWGANIWWHMADARQPEEKVYITATSVCGWGNFHWLCLLWPQRMVGIWYSLYFDHARMLPFTCHLYVSNSGNFFFPFPRHVSAQGGLFMAL